MTTTLKSYVGMDLAHSLIEPYWEKNLKKNQTLKMMATSGHIKPTAIFHHGACS